MNSLILFLIFCQALGAIGGVFWAIVGELAYVRAARDGKIDVAERAHLDALAKSLRFGMSLLLVSSIGLVVLSYIGHQAPQPALNVSYWVFMILSLLIICVSWTLSHRHISFTLGSAIAFTAWWFLFYLALGLFPPLSFGAALIFYVVATAILYMVLRYARLFIIKSSPTSTHS